MRIHIVSGFGDLSYSCAAKIEEAGLGDVDVRAEQVPVYELRHGSSVTAKDILSLKASIAPLSPQIVADENLEGDCVELRLGDAIDFGHWDIRVSTPSDTLNDTLKSDLHELGFSDFSVLPMFHRCDHVQFGGATDFARDCVKWALASRGISALEVKEWGDEDDDIRINVCPPEMRAGPWIKKFPVTVCVDDVGLGLSVTENLKRLGFGQVRVHLMSVGELEDAKIELDVGPLETLNDDTSCNKLLTLFDDLMNEWGVDAERYPVVKSGSSAETGIKLTLPLQSCQKGLLPPYGSAALSRFRVVVFADDEDEGETIANAFRRRGFSGCEVQELGSSDIHHGFYIKWGAAARYQEVSDAVDAIMGVEMERMGAGGESLVRRAKFMSGDTDIFVHVPITGFRLGTFQAQLENPKNFEIGIAAPEGKNRDALKSKLEGMAFDEVETSDEEAPVLMDGIFYGRAGETVIGRVSQKVKEIYGIDLPSHKSLPMTNTNILIKLPFDDAGKDSGEPSEDEKELERAWQDMLGEAPPAPRLMLTASHPFVREADDTVYISDLKLPKRLGSYPLVPSREAFASYCVDQNTAETLQHIAVSVMRSEPCCLEGATSTSKTSSIQYLASLLNQPVLRLNLNGQTDTGELIGKFMPDPDTGGWTWQDGAVVNAMRDGYWLILDELNLAEPQILERLNSVLEAHPTLVKTEHDNSVIGSTENPVHPHFRIFATLNPVDDYAGRSVMSPAYRDRWQAYRISHSPDEPVYADMLRFMIFGEQPPVAGNGILYPGQKKSAAYASLAELSGIDRVIVAIARVHSSIEQAAAGGQLGARKKEKYVFTRRGLISVVGFLSEAVLKTEDTDLDQLVRRALERYYIGKISSTEDRDIVKRLIEAVGIGVARESEAA